MTFQEYINTIVALSPEELEEFASFFHREELLKGDFLYKQGEICRKIFIIEKGLAGVFYYSENGKKITDWFIGDLSAVTAIDSFYNKVETSYNCELIEDTILYSISTAKLENLLNQSHNFAKIAFQILFKITFEVIEFMSILKFQTAKERYTFLIERHPHIFQRVPLFQIASFLGITPETLSRLRAEK